MGRPYDHEYLVTPGARCGTMRCGGCGETITQGEFRAYKRSENHDWKYVTHHRACCADDARWAKEDARKAAYWEDRAEELAEATAFRDKWDRCDLDELIDGLRDQLALASAPPVDGEGQ